MILFAFFLVAVLAFAQQGERCDFPLDRRPSDTAPRSLDGVYDVEWRPDSGAVRSRRLWLWRTMPTDSSTRVPRVRPASGDTLRFLLWGSETTRAVEVSAVDSIRSATDPIDPPVLLLASPRRTDPPILVVGTLTTRRPNVMTLDGAGLGVSVTQVHSRGFSGRYRPWGYGRETGFFCARRLR